MESLNALIQGMGLMHLGIGQAIMLLVSLLLLWLASAACCRISRRPGWR